MMFALSRNKYRSKHRFRVRLMYGDGKNPTTNAMQAKNALSQRRRGLFVNNHDVLL